MLRRSIVDGRHRLPLMPSAADLLEHAHACVSEARDRWALLDGFDAADALLRCQEITQLLEECGAIPIGLLDLQPLDTSPGSLLLRAAVALDEIPAAERTPRLGVARAALTGALLGAPDAGV